MLTQQEQREIQGELVEKESTLEKMEEHLAKGTSVRSKQEWDINAEGPGRILLKCEEKYGQQKYMQSIITKNERGEITNTITAKKTFKKKQQNTGKKCSQMKTWKQQKKTYGTT